MNLFVLDIDPVLAARALSDQHINKMILETAQILDGGTRPILADIDPTAPREIVKIPKTHRDNRIIHSVSDPDVWTYAWMHFLGLLAEFDRRFGHPHSYRCHIHDLRDRMLQVAPRMRERGFVLAMPDQYKTADDRFAISAQAIRSYRIYYAEEKVVFGREGKPMTHRTVPPIWLTQMRAARGYQRFQDDQGRYFYQRVSR